MNAEFSSGKGGKKNHYRLKIPFFGNNKVIFSSFCSAIPAFYGLHTYLMALPSKIGISGALISTKRLSISLANRADITCSIVLTATLLIEITLSSFRTITFSAIALISGCPSKSTRLNIIPKFSGAGLKMAVICKLYVILFLLM